MGLGGSVAITGTSTVGSVVSADMAQARSALSDFQQGGQGASGAVKGLSLDMGGLTGVLGAFGLALSAASVVKFTGELIDMGAAAERATSGLNTATQGHADEYMSSVQKAVHGLIDDEDAAAVSTDLLSRGLVTSAAGAAEFTRVAGTLGEQFRNMPVKEATEAFANMLAGGRIGQLKEFGISVNEVRAKTQALMESTQGLTQAQAQQQAIMDIATAKANQYSGVLDDQAAHLEKGKIRWKDFWEGVGKGLDKNIVGPILDQVDALDKANQAIDQRHQALAAGAATEDDYITLLEKENGGFNLTGLELIHAKREYEGYREAIDKVNTAQLDNLETMRQNRDVGLDLGRTAEENGRKIVDLALAVERYSAELDQNANRQLNMFNQLKSLKDISLGGTALVQAGSDKDVQAAQNALASATENVTRKTIAWDEAKKHSNLSSYDMTQATQALAKAQGDLDKVTAKTLQTFGPQFKGVFDIAMSAMSSYGLSARETLEFHNKLGLATGQVTQKQIDQSAALTALNNLYFKHKIAENDLILGELKVAAGFDITSAAAVTLAKHIEDIGTKAGLTGDNIDKRMIKGIQDAQATMQGTTDKATDISKALDEIDKSKTKINTDDSQVLAALDAVKDVQKKLSELDGSSATVHVNVVQTGSTPPGYQHGTSDFPGGAALVGERGPEIVRLPVHSQIIPNSQIGGMMGGGSFTQSITVSVATSDAAWLVDKIEHEIKMRGKSFARVA